MRATDTLLTDSSSTNYYTSSYEDSLRHTSNHQESKRAISYDIRAMTRSSFFDVIDNTHGPTPEPSQPCQIPAVESPVSAVPVPQSKPFPSSVSHPALSSSPAALFLSAFSSPPPAQAPLPDDEGQDIAGYTLGGVIGRGAFSTIRRAYSKCGGVVAVKIVRRSDLSKQPNAVQAKKRLDHETSAWSSLSHEHILPLFSAVHTGYADYFFTLYCPAGSLFDILKRDGRPALPHDDVGMMLRQVVRGLRYMHEVAAFVHRDMKLENVLVDEMGVCRIADFGMSRKIGEIDEEEDDDEQQVQVPHAGVQRAASMALPASRRHAPLLSVTRHTSVRHRNSESSPNPKFLNPGSLPYAAPELLLPRTSPLAPHPSQDIWALGVMLYTLLTGRLPFSDSFEPRLQMKICNGAFEIPPDIGRGADQVLRGCLERNVGERWTIAMVDEVAWGVGWGTDEDDVEAEAEDSVLLQSSRSSRSCSRTRSSADPFSSEIASVDEPSGPHQEAAQRRSDSRLRRSRSRAPALGGRSRSISRRRSSRAPSPTVDHLTTAILSNGTLSASSCYSPYESALLVSPSSSLDRGRRLTKISGYYTPRSPSPSMVPSTPVDRFRGAMATAEDSKSETIPRRHSGSREVHMPSYPHYVPDDIPIPETGVLEWDDLRQTRGRLSVSTLDESRSRTRDDRSTSVSSWMDGIYDEALYIMTQASHHPKKRAESLPPPSNYVGLPVWSTPELRGRKPGLPVSAGEDRRFLTPVLQVGKIPLPRSRSVGHRRP